MYQLLGSREQGAERVAELREQFAIQTRTTHYAPPNYQLPITTTHFFATKYTIDKIYLREDMMYVPCC
ncbi:hypothetical protein [Chroococcidiopsis sp [FACHB-1243]]|uniref:hypothetical protein n=1 Tax=Chroococcidiopsis sp. [FACHB-1243] TaxID=2692781 RepID=UPI00178309C9|nr:hypothetical protein [Chroococcidiopsis sp. [FACHB-1243]]